MKERDLSRRKFLTNSALIGAAGVVAPAILASCGNGQKNAGLTPLKNEGEYYVPELPDKAIDGKELKVGVIGCGGRGSGAVFNLLDAANGITVTARPTGRLAQPSEERQTAGSAPRGMLHRI